MKNSNSLLLVLLMIFAVLSTVYAQDADEKKAKEAKIKSYAEVITADAVTDSGLFVLHTVDDKIFFEIPFNLLDQEVLIVSRIAGHVKNLNFGGAGMKSRPQQVVRFQRHGSKVLLRSVSFNSVADENDPVYRSVRNNNFEPVIMGFEIAAFNDDSTALVCDVTSFFTTDVAMIGALSKSQRKDFEIKSLDGKRSFIAWAKSFPRNVEVRHVLTYTGSELPDNQLTDALSIEMNQSLILLPEVPMQARSFDSRVGYFSVQQTNYSLDEQRAAQQRFITRWRLEPTDMEAFRRGELVTPKKPIVYYIDPATPEKWRPYIKQGIEDWQIAFEAAGFKDAILAADPPSPEEDPDWSPEDVRYSVIRYITTDIQNAQGPHVHDPRTGEILESDILWYHNVMNLLRNWYFVQTAAVNPEARGVKFKDEIMGRLIRFVAAHEVGHTLGLPHNMGASVAYPVDSLRSPSFTKRMGTAPSIMDYARFNYVAQPEDGDVGLMPNIGPYDKWSIIYGYRPLPQAASAQDERAILNEMIKERADDPLYRYGRGSSVDPSSQTEDLGDDAIKASAYGIANLKRIVPNLVEWSSEPGKEYDSLEELYGQVVGQLRRYMGHVSTNVGGIYAYPKTSDQDGFVFTPVPASYQKAAVQFLNNELFATPKWLIRADILRLFESDGMLQRLRDLQARTLSSLFNADRLKRLSETEALYSVPSYTVVDLFGDVKRSIWSELEDKSAIDPFRRNLQREFLKKMADLMDAKNEAFDESDARAAARGTLLQLKAELPRAIDRKSDSASKFHLQEALAQVNKLLKGGEK
ncbi:zinc-dependent metalloprotease [candidate division KSB1 bacterium]|nr:zinc-dependent metalloprotease [candidate division KSB1 bacterium]